MWNYPLSKFVFTNSELMFLQTKVYSVAGHNARHTNHTYPICSFPPPKARIRSYLGETGAKSHNFDTESIVPLLLNILINNNNNNK